MEPSPISVEASSPPSLAPEIALKSKTAAIEAFESITYGSIAGILGKYIEYPFDTVKVRLQSQPDNLPLRYKGPIDCFRQSLQTDGFLGMYRGISAPLVGAAAETSSLFVFETTGRELLYATSYASRDAALSLPALYATGGFAGALTSFVLTPIELVKCRIQVPSAQAGERVAHLKPLAVVRSVFRHEGIRGFWHGQMGTLIRETGGSAAWFGAKETVTAMFRQMRTKQAKTQVDKEKALVEPLPVWQQMVAGASAGVSYNFIFFPADTIKSRMQTMPTGPNIPRSTFWSEGVSIWNQHGIRGLYRGCGITCLRSAPASAVIFTIFDSLKTHLPMQ